MDKFKSIAILTAIFIFSIAGESQDPLTLRLIVSIASASMLSALYCGLTEDTKSTSTIVLLAASLIAATLADPDPSTLQILLAFVGAPIITAIAIRSEQEKKHETETVAEQVPPQKR